MAIKGEFNSKDGIEWVQLGVLGELREYVFLRMKKLIEWLREFIEELEG